MLSPYRVRVTPEWVDYNHHLNEGAYGVIFSDATDHALIELGFGPAYREAIGGTFYTVETPHPLPARGPGSSRGHGHLRSSRR